MTLFCSRGGIWCWITRCVGLIALLLLVLVALYVGLGRYFITQIGAYEPELETLLSERLGRSVGIQALEGEWQGFDPVVIVDGISVGDADNPDASLQRLRIRLASWSSLLRGRLVFSEFSAHHADLTLTQDDQGGLGLAGLWQPAADEASGLELFEAAAEDFDDHFSDWVNELGELMADPVVHVSDLRLRLQTPGQPDQLYQIPAIDLSFRGGVFSAAGRLIRVDTAETVTWFTLEGQHFFSGGFDGTVFLDIRSERLFDTFLRQYEWFDIGVEGVDLRTSAWLTFERGGIERVFARVATPYLQLRSPSATLAPIEDLQVELTARRLDPPCAEPNPCHPQWEIQAKDLSYRWLGETVGPLDLHWQNSMDGWRLALESLPVESTVGLALALKLLPDWAAQALHDYHPRGQMEQLVLDYGADDYRFSAALRQVSANSVDGAPVVQGLDGWLEHGPTGGRVRYDSADTVFGFPDLFAAAWQFERMTGEVSWTEKAKGWEVAGQDLRFQYGDETLLGGSFQLLLPVDSSSILGLRVGLLRGNHRHLDQFLPGGAVGESLYDWLTQALTDGEIPWGWYYGFGPIGEGAGTSPVANVDAALPAHFTSAMIYDFADADFTYAEGWPGLRDGRGQFRFQDGLGWVDVEAGTVGGLAVSQSQVTIDTTGEESQINVNASAVVNGDDLKFWMTDSPLGDLAGTAPDTITVSGDAAVQLNLGLFPDTDSTTEPRLELVVQANDLGVRHQPTGLEWSGMNGTVAYSSESGLTATGLNGRFLDHEARFELTGGAGDEPVLIHQWGRATIEGLEARGLLEPLPFLGGPFNYDLRASFGETRADRSGWPVLGFQADLLDVVSELPAPLGKRAGERGTLQGNLVFEDNDILRLQGALIVDAGGRHAETGYQLLWDGARLQAATLMLGHNSASLTQGQLRLEGELRTLDLDRWSAAVDSWAGGEGAESSAGELVGRLPLPLTAQIATEQLLLGGIDFGEVDLSLARDNAGWQVGARGQRVTGEITLPDTGPYGIDLQKLVLPPGLTDSTDASDLQLSADASRNYPQASVNIQELWLGDFNYGAWQFELQPTADALQLNGLLARTGSLSFSGDLVWRYAIDPAETDSGGGLTRLAGTLTGGNIRDLNGWVRAGVPLDSASTRAELDLSWSGPPQAFSLASLKGELSLTLEDGQILDQNDTAQIFRVFGVLNADTLMRRLRLDFSDLYKPGVAFEALSGSAVVRDGVLTLDPELQLTGPSGAFRLTGSTQLIEETLDMRLVVVLPLTQNLPVAALLFGAGAPIGGALFILDKLLGDPLSKLTSATYDVSGPWSEPRVKLRNFFDIGSDIRKDETSDPGASPGQ